MTDTPAGWYPVATDPLNLRWWDGTAWTDATSPIPPPTPPARATRRRPFGCLAWTVIGVAVVIIFGVLFTALLNNTDTGKRIKAETACQNVVADMLKAPATAKFTTSKTTGDYPKYVTSGVVDAENGFGANVRSTYSCDVKGSDDGDTWQTSNVAVRQR